MDYLNWETPGSASGETPTVKTEPDSANMLNYDLDLDIQNPQQHHTPQNTGYNNTSSNSQRSYSNSGVGSYPNTGPSPGSHSATNTPDNPSMTSPGIRASLSKALSNGSSGNNNSGNSSVVNSSYPIPEEDDEEEELEEQEHNPFAYEAGGANSLSNSVNSGKGSLLSSSAGNRSRRNTLNSPGGSASSPIDRKRRDNINDKIQELLGLIPKPFFDENKDKSSGTKDGKPNKGQILSKSVDYISYLQGQIDERNRKEVELSIKLRNLEIANSIPVEQRMNLLHTSAEIGLARIGVGPLAEQPEENEDESRREQGESEQGSGAQSNGTSNQGSDIISPNR